VKNVPSLGFILGDEGSGASLGRRLIQAVYRGVLPADLAEIFTQETGLTQPEVLRRVYNEPKPNKFVASLTPFLSAHIDREEIRCLVEEEFTLFFRNQLSGYSQIEQVPVGFVGSIAKVFEPQLRNVADRFKVKIHNILDVPMPGLISYHTEK
jgi:hypothetical protein